MNRRTQRFNPGDLVTVERGGLRLAATTVTEVFLDPHPPGYEHCAGKSARYRLDGYPHDIYDWMLEPATK